MNKPTNSDMECCVKHGGQLIRLRKIEGQVKGIQKMISEDRYCVDILTQIKSTKNALVKVEENILKRHIQTCVYDAVKSGEKEDIGNKMAELMKTISKFS